MYHYPLVTVIGGGGFVGRHVVKLLASSGYRIRVLARDTIAAEFLKTAATVGQIAIEYADITRPQTLSGKFHGSDAVVNLTGILYPAGRQSFHAVHQEGAKNIAEEAAQAGIKTLVHLSSGNIEKATDTKYGASKLAGETAIRSVFPGAAILRASLIVGPEDGFFQRFARLSLIAPALPLIGGGKTKFQPVLVEDVARAVLAAIRTPEAAGTTYELRGPAIYSFRELLELIARITGRSPCLISIPTGVAKLMGRMCELLPFPPAITRDQVKLLAHDLVDMDGKPGFAALGLTPTPIEDALPTLLARYIKR